MKHICIIGVGELGSAIAHILSVKKDVRIDCWDIDPSRVPGQKKLEEVVPCADVVFLTVPSSSLRSATVSVLPYLSVGTVVASCAKGIEQKSKKTADQILSELLRRGQPSAVIGGPMLAEELSGGGDGYAVVASKSKQTCKRVQDIFKKTPLHLEGSTDMHGVALCGVMKNMYAIGLGIVDGLKLGDNCRGRIVTQALREMMVVLPLLGGKKETVLGLAGIGDLIATGSSRYSSNYHVGVSYGKGEVSERHCEGHSSIGSLTSLVRGQSKNLPLLFTIKNILSGRIDSLRAFKKFLK